MARRLEKIEKEMGYCEVKLERERRFRTQIEFLSQEVHDFEQLTRLLGPHDALLRAGGGLRSDGRPSRQAFLAAGLLDLAAERRDWLERVRDELAAKLHHYAGFDDKKRGLEDEKQITLSALSGNRFEKMRRLVEDFKRTERHWNELTEDSINVDEALSLVGRNLDYLRSARNFLIAAKGDYDVENLRHGGYLPDIFRHSNIGRAREMVDGADTNILLAQKSIICLRAVRGAPPADAFVRALIPFIDALYEDLFVGAQIRLTVQVVEAALATNLKLEGRLKACRDQVMARLEAAEKARSALFQQMGAGRRREMVT